MAEESIILAGISTLRDIGFFDFLLPFLLFFTIVYGVLAKSKIFAVDDQERRDINAVVAFVISLIATTTSWVLLALNQFLPWVGFMTVVVLGFLIIGSMMTGGDVTKIITSSGFRWVAVTISALAVLIVAYFSLGWNEIAINLGFTETDIALVIIGTLFVVAIGYLIYGGKSSKSSAAPTA